MRGAGRHTKPVQHGEAGGVRAVERPTAPDLYLSREFHTSGLIWVRARRWHADRGLLNQ